jgi:hypothetical protein
LQATGVDLGERFKAAWELAAVMGQVQVYGWQSLIVRCRAQGPRTHTSQLTRAHALVNTSRKAKVFDSKWVLARAQIAWINRVRHRDTERGPGVSLVEPATGPVWRVLGGCLSHPGAWFGLCLPSRIRPVRIQIHIPACLLTLCRLQRKRPRPPRLHCPRHAPRVSDVAAEP